MLAAVKEAERIVQEGIARGGAAFTIDSKKQGIRIANFHPRAEETIVVLPLAGG